MLPFRFVKLSIFALFYFLVSFSMSAPVKAESIQFWSALPKPDSDVMQALVDKYNVQNPNHQVVYQNFSSTQDYSQALNGQNPPELALVDCRWLETLKNRLISADDILLKAGEFVRAVAQGDTFKQIWNACLIGKKAYGIPFSAETAALAINPSQLKKVPQISTEAQLQNFSAQIHKTQKNVRPFVLPLSWPSENLAALWYTYMQSLTQKPINLSDELHALNSWWSWVNRLQPSNNAALPNDFTHSASVVVAPRDMESLPDKTTLQLLPKGQRFWGYLHVEALVFFGSKNGWDFANYLTSYPQLKGWSMKTPTVPVNKQVYLSPDYIQQMDAHRPWLRTFIAAVLRAAPLPALHDEAQWETIGQLISQNLKNELPTQNAALKIHYALFNEQKEAQNAPQLTR